MPAQPSISFGFLKYFACIVIKGMKMPINRAFIPTPNLIKFIYLESLLREASNPHHGGVSWKPFKIQKKKGKG